MAACVECGCQEPRGLFLTAWCGRADTCELAGVEENHWHCFAHERGGCGERGCVFDGPLEGLAPLGARILPGLSPLPPDAGG